MNLTNRQHHQIILIAEVIIAVIKVIINIRPIITARCTTVQSRSCDRMSSVCPPVCLSVTLVDQDHIGWKSWKLIARTISPTPSLFVAQRTSTYSKGNMGKFGGDYHPTEVGWEKMAFWSTKAAISLKRVKIEKSYYGGPIVTHLCSFERYHPRPPTAFPSPRLGVLSTSHPDRNKRPYREKYSRVRTQGLLKIFRALIYRAHRVVIFAVARLSCCYCCQVPGEFRGRRSWCSADRSSSLRSALHRSSASDITSDPCPV